MDEIYGVNLDMLAELFQQQSDCNARYGRTGGAEFEKILAQRGLDINTWANAWNAWGQRFKADPTGMTEAGFHQRLQGLAQKAHFGDVRDMSADTEEGVTLDTYAQITVGISRTGADVESLVRQHGLTDIAHWQRVNAAWAAKMGADTTHKLTMQYGQLYQKYAGPSLQQEQLAQTAAILADRNKPRDRIDEPREELTPDLCRQKMQSPSQNERFKYAYLYANMIDLNNVPDKNEAIMAVTPILMEMIERHDDSQPNEAERGTKQLWEIGVRGDDFRGAVARAVNRGQSKLHDITAALDPIRNSAVPERIFLQTAEHDWQAMIESLNEYLSRDWNPVPTGGASAMSMAPGMGSGSVAFHSRMPPPKSGGFPKLLLAPVIILAVGGGLYLTKGREFLAARAAAAASASASPSASAPVAKGAVSTTAATTAPAGTDTPAATASAAIPAPKAAKGKRKKK